jgi:hypothetical protein
MFHIIAIMIFYFRSWCEVKHKRQAKNRFPALETMEGGRETYGFLRFVPGFT